MNRIEWTPKDQYIEYHVLKWPTSHLHPRERTTTSGSVELKEKPSGAATSDAQPTQQEGLGLGAMEPSNRVRWRAGGLGTDGVAQEGARETAQGKEGTAAAGQQTGHQSSNLENMSAALQPMMSNETYRAVYGAAYRVGQAVQKIGGQIRGAADRLRDVYQRQYKKEAVPLRRNHSPMQQKEKRGTRQISKDEVLAMQSENHYLLDSYDKNGQYSVLGK